MTRAELRQLVRDLSMVLEHEASNALIDRFLNEGYDKVCHRKKWSWLLQPPELVNVTAWPFDLTTLSLPVYAIYDVVEATDVALPLVQVTRNDASFFFSSYLNSGTRPQCYYVEGSSLYVVPEAAVLDLRISYYSIPTWLPGDDDEPGMPTAFQERTIANFAISRVWERQEDFDRADAYLDRYDQGLGELIYEENTQRADRPKIFGEIAGSTRRHPNMPFLDGV